MADTLEFNEIYQEVKGSMVSELGGDRLRGALLRPQWVAPGVGTHQNTTGPLLAQRLCHRVLVEDGSLEQQCPGTRAEAFPSVAGAAGAGPEQSGGGHGWECGRAEGRGCQR